MSLAQLKEEALRDATRRLSASLASQAVSTRPRIIPKGRTLLLKVGNV